MTADSLLDSIPFNDTFERDYAEALDLFANRIVWAVSDRRINPYAYGKRLEWQRALKDLGSFFCLGLTESFSGEKHSDNELSEDDFRLKYYLASKNNYIRKIELLEDCLFSFNTVANRAHPLDEFLPIVRDVPAHLPDGPYDELNWAEMRLKNGLGDRGARASILLASQATELGHDMRTLGWAPHVVTVS